MMRDLGQFSLEERELRGDPFNAFKYLMARSQADEDRVFSVVHSDRTRGNEWNTQSSIPT